MTTFSANTPGRKRTSQTTSSSRRPLTHAAINTNQGARLGTSTLKCDRPSTLPERADAKVRRTRGVSRIQLEDSLSIGTASPPEKRQRIDQGENLIAEQDAVIYAQHWEFVRTPTLPPSPERSRAENKALAMWLGAYLSEMFIADMALRWFVSEALARDLEHTLDFFYPDNVVVFLALKYVVDLLPQTRFDERGRNEADCAIMILRAFLSALSLASKWMDDYAQPLHDWAPHMHLSKANVTELEILALATLDWNLSVTPPQWTSWLFYLQKGSASMDSKLLSWKAVETVVGMVRRSLQEMLDIYTPDPFDPLPSQDEISRTGRSNGRRAEASANFRTLLAVDLGKPITGRGSSSLRRSTVSATPILGDSTREGRLPLNGNYASRRESISTYRPSRSTDKSTPPNPLSISRSVLISGVEEPILLEPSTRADTKNKAIHRWLENVAPGRV